MEAICLAVILLSGYVYSSKCLITQYKTKRLDGQRLYIVSTGRGLIFLIITTLLLCFIHNFFPAAHQYLTEHSIFSDAFLLLSDEKKGYTPWLIIVSIGSLVISTISIFLVNFLFSFWSKLESLPDWVPKYSDLVSTYIDDQFEYIIVLSIISKKPFVITTSNDKVYIGYPRAVFEPSKKEDSEIIVKPIYLGYLSPEDKDIIRTIDYELLEASDKSKSASDIDKRREEKERDIVIPKDKIISMSIFDDNIYRKLTQLKNQPSNDNMLSKSAHLKHSDTGAADIGAQISLEYNNVKNNGFLYSGPNNVELSIKENESGEVDLNYKTRKL